MNGDSVRGGAELPVKRKREATADDDQMGWLAEDSFTDTLKDLSLLLSKYDSELGILRRPLAHAAAGEPDNKRVKRSRTAVEAQTIQSLVDKAHYQSLQPFLHDIEQAISSYITESQRHENKTRALSSSSSSISPSSELSTRANRFRKELNRLVLKLPPRDVLTDPSVSTKTEDTSDLPNTSSRNDRLALALVDNTPNGRQIFSSLQASDLPINETTLPKGLVVTKVVPFNPLHLEGSRSRVRTLGEVFAPLSNLHPLERPQKRPVATGSSVVRWLDPLDAVSAASNASANRRGYSSMTLPSGSWLNYGYENSSYSSSHHSQVSKQASVGKETPTKEDGFLFQSLYSSFAPSFDSSGAVAPRAAKCQAWWEQSGASRVGVLFSSEKSSEIECHSILNQVLDPELSLDEDTLAEAVESFQPDTYLDRATEASEEPQTESEGSKKSADEIGELLKDISDLLQTLNSYRQLRNLSQTSPDKGEATADTPSDAEHGIYETLKSSLSTLVSSLPPYAVSKLTGEQLAELNLSKKLLLDGPDYPGTLEDDDFTKQRKQAAQIQQNATMNMAANPRGGVPATVAPAARPPPPNTYHQTSANAAPAYQRQPSTRSKHIPVPYQAPPPGYPSRPPPPPHYQQPQQQQHQQQPTGSPGPYPPGQRQGYIPPQYQQQPQQQATPSAVSPYSRTGMLQQFQRSTSNGGPPYPQRRPSPAQTPAQAYPHRTPQAPYQPIHGASQQPQQHTASPIPQHTASPIPRPGYSQSPQRTPYMSPSTPQPRYFQQQTPQQVPYYPPNQANQATVPVPVPVYSKPPYSRSAAEQAVIMDRNKMQLQIPNGNGNGNGTGNNGKGQAEMQPNGGR